MASLQRTRKAISAGHDPITCTGGDQDRPKVPIPKGKAIPKRPQQQSPASNNPAGNGYGCQPQRPGTHPESYAGGQYRPPGGRPYQPDMYGNPPPGHQRRAESADYHANHPQGFQAQGGYFAAPPGASQLYPPPQQHQRSRDPYSPPSPYSPPGFQPASRDYSMPNPNYQPNQYPQQTSSYQQQPPEPVRGLYSWPQTAELTTIASSSNPQQGDCPECGGVQRFLHP